MNQKMSIAIRGKHKTWGFTFVGDPKYIPDWKADGLDVREVLNVVPLWAQKIGLSYFWIRIQDSWRFLRFW